MADLTVKRHPMPAAEPEIRNKNFDEVALGYDAATALSEASRCLNCKNRPCVSGCPVGVDIPEFIAEVAAGNFEGAYSIIQRTSSLPAVCGRVCPQETQCEAGCVRGIKGESVAIGRLERFVADYAAAHGNKKVEIPESTGKSVAVVGSGPAGLACAGELAKKGYAVTVFEALHIAGGVLSYGIPEFRLPKSIVKREIEGLTALGVKIETDTVIGKTFSVDELFKMGYDAVFIGSGAGLPKFMNIPGENLKGVFSANEILTRVNLMKAYRNGADTPIMKADRVAVVGGGNVAMDAARCAKRLGAERVTIVYRRTETDLPARAEEIEHAKEEGIVFRFLTNPVAIFGNSDGFVTSMLCDKMEASTPGADGRFTVKPIPGNRVTLDVDCVIMAIGTSPNPLIKSTTEGLDTQKWGGIIADSKTGRTSKPGVWAGGDAVTGAATVILAMGAGKSAAEDIDRELSRR